MSALGRQAFGHGAGHVAQHRRVKASTRFKADADRIKFAHRDGIAKDRSDHGGVELGFGEDAVRALLLREGAQFDKARGAGFAGIADGQRACRPETEAIFEILVGIVEHEEGAIRQRGKPRGDVFAQCGEFGLTGGGVVMPRVVVVIVARLVVVVLVIVVIVARLVVVVLVIVVIVARLVVVIVVIIVIVARLVAAIVV